MSNGQSIGFRKRRIAAAVVVDSRNVRGQVSDLFGHPRHAGVGGVVGMLDDYGFAVTDVFVGIATVQPSSASAALSRAVAGNLAFAEQVIGHPLGAVLHGRLVERRADGGATRLEEKLVDVQCAVQVARLAQQIKDGQRQGVIIVLSEDMDLIPAYEYAAELGVTVYAAANDTVHTRSQHSNWLLLTEGALLKAAGRGFGRDSGSELRRRMAQMLTAAERRPLNFKVVRAAAGGVQVTHNSGARALWVDAPATRRAVMGERKSLYLAGVDWPEGTAFPRLLVTSGSSPDGPADLCRAVVVRHPTPTRVEVELESGGRKSLSGISPGSLVPGMSVLVHVQKHGRQKAWRLVGPLERRPETPQWADPMAAEVVRVTSGGAGPGARVRAMVLSSGAEVTLQPPAEDRGVVGAEYAAVPAIHTDAHGGTHVVVVAISSRVR